MSHLSILPTVLRDADLVATCLESMGLRPQRGGQLTGFAGERRSVLVQLQLSDGVSFGWCLQADGCLALVGDLQRLSRSRSLEPLLAQLTREYAARDALQQAQRLLPDALIQLGV